MLRREGETGWLSQYRYSCEARKCALQAFHNARLRSSEAARRSAEPGLQRGDQDPALQHPAPLLQQSRIHRCYIAAQSAPQRLEAPRSGAVTVPCPEKIGKRALSPAATNTARQIRARTGDGTAHVSFPPAADLARWVLLVLQRVCVCDVNQQRRHENVSRPVRHAARWAEAVAGLLNQRADVTVAANETRGWVPEALV